MVGWAGRGGGIADEIRLVTTKRRGVCAAWAVFWKACCRCYVDGQDIVHCRRGHFLDLCTVSRTGKNVMDCNRKAWPGINRAASCQRRRIAKVWWHRGIVAAQVCCATASRSVCGLVLFGWALWVCGAGSDAVGECGAEIPGNAGKKCRSRPILTWGWLPAARLLCERQKAYFVVTHGDWAAAAASQPHQLKTAAAPEAKSKPLAPICPTTRRLPSRLTARKGKLSSWLSEGCVKRAWKLFRHSSVSGQLGPILPITQLFPHVSLPSHVARRA